MDLERFSHLSEGFDLSVQPFMDKTTHGIFSTRAPRRADAIGLSVVHLLSIENGSLVVEGVDMVDKTRCWTSNPLSLISTYPMARSGPDGWRKVPITHRE